MNNQINDLDTKPWFKQGWPWVLIAIPFLTIVACSITIYIAFNTDDSLVKDNYYKEGLAINRSIERVEKAQTLAIVAKLEINKETNLVYLNLQSNESMPNIILLQFYHPTLKIMDQSFQLEPLSEGEYVAEITNLQSVFWHVNIEDESQTWLIKSRWLYPTKTSIIIDANDL